MEIPAWIYFSFWAFIGVLSLFLGMEALKETKLPTSLSPAIVVFFRHFLAIATCHSSTYALVFRAKMKIHAATYYMWFAFGIFPIAFAAIAGESSAAYYAIYAVIDISVVIFYFLPWSERVVEHDIFHTMTICFAFIPLLNFMLGGDSFGWFLSIFIFNFSVLFHIHYAAIDDGEQFSLLFHYYLMSVLLMLGEKHYSPLLVLFLTLFTLLAHAAISGDERRRRWLHAVEKIGKLTEFVIGMAAAVLFNYFFRLTDHAAAFFFFAVAWLAILALLLCRYDFGIFNFLLCNVIVGCTAGQLELRGTTFIACGTALLLYILRRKLELVSVVDRGEEKASVIAWGESQITEIGALLPRFQ